jgi:hypothetical protein
MLAMEMLERGCGDGMAVANAMLMLLLLLFVVKIRLLRDSGRPPWTGQIVPKERRCSGFKRARQSQGALERKESGAMQMENEKRR